MLCQFDIPHNIIVSTTDARRIVSEHVSKHKKSFYNPKSRVTVASVDTLKSKPERFKRVFDLTQLLLVDEAHHVLKENKWGEVVSYFQNPQLKILGVTATPQRLDRKGLGHDNDGVFNKMVTTKTVKWGIDNKYLSKYKLVLPQNTPILALKDKSDYTTKELNDYVNENQVVGKTVENWFTFANGLQTIVFAATLEHGEQLLNEFKAKGVKAVFLHGMTNAIERFKGVKDFANNSVQVIINVDLFDEGFDSLTLCTEVLTPSGWKKYNEIKKGDECYAWDAVNEKIEIKNVDRVVTRTLRPNEKFYSIKSQHTDINVTERHNIFYRKKDYYTKNLRSTEHYVSQVKDVFKYAKPYSIPTSSFANFKGLNLSDDEIRFIGWSLTDASLSKSDSIKIYQSKPKYVTEIKKLLVRLAVKHSEIVTAKEEINKRKGSYGTQYDSYTFGISKKCEVYKKLIKYIKPDFCNDLHDMTREQFDVFWGTLLDADGTRQGTKRGRLCTVDKNFCDNLMQMGVLRGYTPIYGNYHTKKGILVYNLGMKDSTYIQLTKRDSRGAKFTVEEGKSSDMVWCITNELGTIITRRNGKVAILGNCPNEKGKRIVECVIGARPTMSLAKARQQWGRGLRPADYKDHAIIIDQAGNVERHGLPTKEIKWTLDRITKKSLKQAMVTKTCYSCGAVNDRFNVDCEWCGVPLVKPKNEDGSKPRSLNLVDGDLVLVDPDELDKMYRSTKLDSPQYMFDKVNSSGAGYPAAMAAFKNQEKKIETQKALADMIAKLYGYYKLEVKDDRELHKKLYADFGVSMFDMLNCTNKEMNTWIEKIGEFINETYSI